MKVSNTLYVSKDFNDYIFEEGSNCERLINELIALFEDLGFTTSKYEEFIESKCFEAYLYEDAKSLKDFQDDLTFVLALSHALDINFDLGGSYFDDEQNTAENFNFNTENNYIEITDCYTGEKENLEVDEELLSEFIENIKEIKNS